MYIYIYTIALTFKVSGVLDDEKVISAVFYHWIQFVSSFSVPETRICPLDPIVLLLPGHLGQCFICRAFA